jgi:hypothetical protein
MDLKQENNEQKKLVVSYAEDLGIKVVEIEKTIAHLHRSSSEVPHLK